MPNPTNWTDVLNDSIAGMKDFWLITEGPEITVDASGIIELTAGYQSIGGSGTITQINGAQRNGQFAAMRVSEGASIQFGTGGNLRMSTGLRTVQRWVMVVFRDGYWEEQALSLGDFSSGVIAFNGRTGNVVPLIGDYLAGTVGATDPTGHGATTTQGVLDALNGDIENLETTIITAGYVKSFNGRKNDVLPASGDYTAPIVPMTPFTVSSTTIPGPTTQDALQQIVAAIGGVAPGGVLSFNSRTGNVIPLAGDYSATLVTATDPTGSGGTNVQTVLNNLNTKIGASGGGADGTGITEIHTGARQFKANSSGYPIMILDVYGDIKSDLVSSRQIVNYGSINNGIAAGSVFDQLAALTYRESYSILYNGSLAQNALIRPAKSVGEAFSLIPDEILTAGSVTPTIRGNWTFQGTQYFNNISFSGTITGITGRIQIQNGPTISDSGSLAAGGGDSFNVASPGTGWNLICVVIENFSSSTNRVLATPCDGYVVLTNIHDTTSNTWSATAHGVYWKAL